MRPELIVAGKEFRDHLTSKRFIIVFAVLMLLAVYSMVTGMSQYNQMLEDYKKNAADSQQQPWFQEQVASLNKQIQDAEARGDTEQALMLKDQLNLMLNPQMPSALYVFMDFGRYFTIIAMVLSIAIGFDLITREKEEGSLKSLLSHPLYRDAIINGKTLGAAGVLSISLAAMFLITVAIMLFYGVIPSGDDILRIASFFLMALLYCGVFFALAMMASTIAKSSAMSVLYVMGIVIVMVMVPQFSYQISNAILGPAPQPILYEGDMLMKGTVAVNATSGVASVNSTGDIAVDKPAPVPPVGWNDEFQQYYEKQRFITDTINAISPMTNFGDRISYAILGKYDTGGIVRPLLVSSKAYIPYHVPTVWESLVSVWVNILALCIELVVPLAISYVAFMRADVR